MRRPIQQSFTDHAQLLPELQCLQGVWNLFHLMDIAEQEIGQWMVRLQSRKRRHLEMGFSREGIDTLDQSLQRVSKQAFAILCPPELLRGKCEQVYRAHVRELLQRVVNNQDTTAPTQAELLCAMLEMSYRAPLNCQYTAVAEHLYPRVMDRPLDGTPTPEPWTGATQEALTKLSRKLLVRDRVLRPLQ